MLLLIIGNDMVQSANGNKFLSSTSVRHSMFTGPYSNPQKVNIEVDMHKDFYLCACVFCFCVGTAIYRRNISTDIEKNSEEVFCSLRYGFALGILFVLSNQG